MSSWARKRHGDSKRGGIERRGDTRTQDRGGDSATNGDAKLAVDPERINPSIIELFLVGSDTLSYAEMVENFSPAMLKVLDFSKMHREVRYLLADGKKGSRVGAALEASYLEEMDKQRRESGKADGDYVIPVVAVNDRDGKDEGMSVEQMLETLKAKGYKIEAPEPQSQPEDPAVQQLAATMGIGLEEAAKIYAILQQSNSGQQPQSGQQADSNPDPSNSNSSRGGGVGGGR